MFKHEDDRRTLIEWSGGKVSKALIAKRDCVVGDHYHKNKTESFLLLSGEAVIEIDSLHQGTVTGPVEFSVPPNTYHRFTLSKGSILLGVCSEEFDPADEIKGRP